MLLLALAACGDDGARSDASDTLDATTAHEIDASPPDIQAETREPDVEAETSEPDVGEPADPTLTPEQAPFGDVVLGETETLDLTLANDGDLPIVSVGLALSGEDAAAFTVSGCDESLAGGASCTLTLTFSPTRRGAHAATLELDVGETLTAALSGSGLAPAALAVEPSAYRYPTIAVGDDAVHDFTLTNAGDVATGAVELVVGGDFTLIDDCDVLAAGASCSASVTFTPSAAGARTATLEAHATPGGSAFVTLDGDALPRLEQVDAAGLPSAITIAFGDVLVSRSGTALVRLRNNSRDAHGLTLTPTPPFSVGAVGCGETIAAGATCDVTLALTPTAVGPVTGTLTATTDVEVTVALAGSGVATLGGAPTAITLTPATIVENAPAQTVVGALTATDVDDDQTYTFTLVAGDGDDDNALFTIVDGALVALLPLDREADETRTVRVRVVDSGEQAFEQILTVTVSNVDEPTIPVNDLAKAAPGETVLLDVLANDIDDGGGQLISVAEPYLGTATITNNLIRYVAGDEEGPDLLVYTVDGGLTGRVALNVFDPSARWPALACNGASHLVITYGRGLAQGSEVMVRRYALATGEPLAEPVRVNAVTQGTHRTPSVAADNNGNHVIAWQAQAAPGGDGGDIWAQRYNAAGAALGAAFRPAENNTHYQDWPSVAVNEGGAFVIAWGSEHEDDFRTHTYARRFAAGGAAATAELRLDQSAVGHQGRFARIGSIATGFALAWEDNVGDNNDIYVARFNNAGAVVTASAKVNTTHPLLSRVPWLDMNESGAYVVAWTAPELAANQSVRFRRYDASGAVQGGEVVANTFANGLKSAVRVAVANDGTFALVWQSQGQDGSGAGVYLRRFSAAGAPLGGEVRVAPDTAGDQREPAIAACDDNSYVVAWVGPQDVQTPRLRRYAANGTLVW